MMVRELGGSASQPNIRPIPLFKILKGTGRGSELPNSLRFWACARHANCRNEVRIAKNCPRIATRIAKLASGLPPELPGGACEQSAELGCCLYARVVTWHAAIELKSKLPRAAHGQPPELPSWPSSCHRNCQTVHASCQLTWAAVCMLEWSHDTQRLGLKIRSAAGARRGAPRRPGRRPE